MLPLHQVYLWSPPKQIGTIHRYLSTLSNSHDQRSACTYNMSHNCMGFVKYGHWYADHNEHHSLKADVWSSEVPLQGAAAVPALSLSQSKPGNSAEDKISLSFNIALVVSNAVSKLGNTATRSIQWRTILFHWIERTLQSVALDHAIVTWRAK